MDFSFSEELSMLRDSVESFISSRYSLELRTALSQSDKGYSTDIWSGLGDQLGLLSMTLPESAGGLGMDAIATAIVMEALGKGLVMEPYLETVVMAATVLQQSDTEIAARLLSEIGAGQLVSCVAWSETDSRHSPLRVSTKAEKKQGNWRLNGHKSVVHAAPWADGFIVSARVAGERDDPAGIALFWVDKTQGGVTLHPYPTIDGRWAADIELKNVELTADAALIGEDQGADTLELLMLAATAAVCAEGVGVAKRLLNDTVEYCKQRRQFGQPISQFQALQHRMVDMHIAVEMAASASLLASISLASEHKDTALNVSMAKARVNQTCRFVGQSAVQLHGGMGLTDELAVSHYFKRATVIEHLFGSGDYHTERVAKLAF